MTDQLNETQVAWNKTVIDQARNVVENTPLPTTRDEAWKYTRVAKLGKQAFQAGTSVRTAQPVIDQTAYRIEFVNGHLVDSSTNDLPKGVRVEPLSSTEQSLEVGLELDNELFNAINTLYLNDGVSIVIDDEVVLDKPIEIAHSLSGETVISNFKTIVRVGKRSKGHVIQGFYANNAAGSFANCTTEIYVADSANFTINKLQTEEETTQHIGTDRVFQNANSTFTINTITLNGGLVRNNLQIDVNGENCTTNLNGAYLLKGKQHVDNHTTVDHKVAHCNSNELYKGVMDDQSTAVFNGKVFVRKDAQKINAFQSNGNVLISDDATINSKPELEIYADDVKCSHGSTTGQLDEDAVFYLRARGLSEKSARQLMVSAFVGEVFEMIESEPVLDYINQVLADRFGWSID